MANLLKITKEENEQFSFVLNGDLLTEIINTRNDLLTIGNECHFKTSNGANLIKQQNVIYSNVSLFNGVTPVASPTSVRDLFDKLTALEFFEWIKGVSAGGVNRFDELDDTFEYFGRAGQFVVVSNDELQLTTVEFTPIENSTQISDFPSAPVPFQMLVRNEDNTAWIQKPVPAGANGYIQAFVYTSPDPQEFTLATTASLISVVINGTLADPVDWIQSGNLLTILPTYTLNADDRIIVTGVI